MKKLLALLLALMLVMVNVAALATEPGDTDPSNPSDPVTDPVDPEDPKDPEAPEETTEPDIASELSSNDATEEITFEIIKKYTFTVVEDDEVTIPAHTLSFTVEGEVQEGSASTVEDAPEVIIEDLEIEEEDITGEETKEYEISITLPEYEEVGIYLYTITEDDTKVAGVTYHIAPWYMKVTVIRENDELVVGGIAIRESGFEDDGTKTDTFENEFKSGALTVTKQVTGNLGDYNQDWTITVDFESEKEVWNTVNWVLLNADGDEENSGEIFGDGTNNDSIEVVMKHDWTLKVTNIPTDVTYTVAEEEENTLGYTTTYENEEGDIAAAETIAAVITNKKDVTVDTGVTLETLPYVLIMTIAMAGAVLMMVRRRQEQE